MIQLQLEVTAVCNARCVFCQYPQMVRRKGIMREGLFRKIIDEAQEIDSISEVSFQGLGEPMLDPGIFDKIKYAKTKNPRWTTTMYTNGSHLTVENGMVLEGNGLDVLYVSVNAIDARGRREIMKLDDFDKVHSVTKELTTRCNIMKIVPKGVVSMDFFKGEDVDEFKEQWGHRAFLNLEGNWAGQMRPVRVLDHKACKRAIGQIMVLWDGRISLCCFDGEGEVIFGDLNHETLRECYRKPEWLSYRQLHIDGRRAELPLCNNCTAI